ncbi:hypothetical protein HH308_00650 [Gordonia sp. TBRC 11910]|uniref:Uncharacterized protein n=1 Tax=Gordonia asplenii TaxID=2725283 RepID=A0A848KS78_9ACTN|nr:hypothetical protein [Gordonia asplenii]NMN99724.1 hypothetical protein [Gordonia asplenii]
MTAESTMIHDAESWRGTAARLTVLRDDVAALARQVAGLDYGPALGGDAGGRSAHGDVAAMHAHVVDSLRRCAAQLGAYAHDVTQGSRRIIDADGGSGVTSDVGVTVPMSNESWRTLAVQQDSYSHATVPPIVDELAPGRWPTADSAGLLRAAAALRGDARQLTNVDLLGPGLSRGRAVDAMSDTVGSIVQSPDGVVAYAARSMVGLADALQSYADAASTTRDHMSTIAARVDLDRARGRLLAQLGGESALVEPAAAGRLALSESAEHYRSRVEDIGRRHEPSASPGGGSPSGLGAVVAGVGGAMAGAGGSAIRRRAARSRPDVDVEYLRRRAEHLAQRLPATLGVAMSVGIALTEADEQIVVVTTSDDHDYLRPGVTLESDETFAGCGRAPELTLLHLCAQLRVDLAAVASTTPAPEQIAETLAARRVRVVAPRGDFVLTG